MTKYIKVSTWIVKETEKAIAIEYANGRQGSESTNLVWLPKSKVIITHPEDYADKNRMQILIPAWCINPTTINSFEYNRMNGFEGIITQ